MKTVGFALLTIFAAIGVFAAGLFALARYENPSQSFATYGELAASGLIERGWVSEYLPRSAYEMDESHDIDTNEGRTSFEFTPGDTSLARQHCQLLHSSNHVEKYVCPPFEGQTSILLLKPDGHGQLVTQSDD